MLIPLAENFDDIKISLVYASKNNFTGQTIYREGLSETYIHEKVAVHLEQAVKQLKTFGLYFKVWDAFRPLEAQQSLWNYMPDENIYFTSTNRIKTPLSRCLRLI